jgi:hypothetical protein
MCEGPCRARRLPVTHIDAATLEKIVNELLDVPGNRSFRNAIEELARELMRR